MIAVSLALLGGLMLLGIAVAAALGLLGLALSEFYAFLPLHRATAHCDAREAYEDYAGRKAELEARARMQRAWMEKGVKNARRKQEDNAKGGPKVRHEETRKRAPKARPGEEGRERGQLSAVGDRPRPEAGPGRGIGEEAAVVSDERAERLCLGRREGEGLRALVVAVGTEVLDGPADVCP